MYWRSDWILGALSLILFNQHAPPNAPISVLGNFLFVVNASTYGLYMIYVKPLSEKYNTIHLLKWFFHWAGDELSFTIT